MGVYEKLLIVQKKLNAPKSKYNKFGGYYYRSAEDILDGVKDILDEIKATLVLSDEIVQVADRIYIKANATFVDIESGEKIENTSFAREPISVKGMSDPQITGASSTYARKYALNGLFCIDDTVDDDTEELKNEKNNRIKQENKQASQSKQNTQQQSNPTNTETTEVDQNLIPHGGMITQEQLKMLHSEMERTGITQKTIFGMFKIEKFEDMTEVQAIACLNKFKATPDKKD